MSGSKARSWTAHPPSPWRTSPAKTVACCSSAPAATARSGESYWVGLDRARPQGTLPGDRAAAASQDADADVRARPGRKHGVGTPITRQSPRGAQVPEGEPPASTLGVRSVSKPPAIGRNSWNAETAEPAWNPAICREFSDSEQW
jgi:hypothetical protein